jgi:AraC-like DNA-binding protein
LTIGSHISRIPLALDRCRLFRADSVRDIQASIGRVLQPHTLSSLDHAEYQPGFMDYLAFPSIGVGRIEFGRMALEVEQGDFYLLVLCRRGRATVRCSGSDFEIRDDIGILLAPGDKVRARFLEDCQQIVVRLDAAALRRHFGGEARLARRIDLGNRDFAPWMRAISLSVGDPETVARILSRDDVAAAFGGVLLTTLLTTEGLVETAPAHGIVPASVRRAEEYIREHFRESLALDDIAAASLVPARTLLQSYRTFMGTSPMRRLTEVRLDAARASLLAADPGQGVLNCALQAGFNHPSRFAQAYRERFGENPSDTLGRRTH